MKRVFRIVRSIVCGYFVLFFIATVVLWIRSFSIADTLEWNAPLNQTRSFYSSRGRLGTVLQRDAYTADQLQLMNILAGPRAAGIQRRTQTPSAIDATWRWLRIKTDQSHFGVQHRTGRLGLWDVDQWSMPYWIPAALFAIPLPFLAVRVTRRMQTRRRLGRKQCVNCGYDLRATPQRCPECGTAMPGETLA